MPPSALALVILAGLIHASWNIVAKKVGGDVRFAMFTAVMLTLVWAPVALWAALNEPPVWDSRAWLLVLLSGAVHVLYYLTLLRGYRMADLTVVYPLARGSGPLLSSTVALLFLGEALTAFGLLGIGGVVAGVFLIAGGPRMFRPGRDPAERARVRAGVFYGVATGVFIAGYTVVDGYCVKVLGISPILVDYVGNLFRIVLMVPMIWPLRAGLGAVWRAQWRAALFVGAIGPVSYVMVLYAMQVAPLSHVAPAREVSMLFAALIGGQLLQEGDRNLRIVGAALIAAGVMAIALG